MSEEQVADVSVEEVAPSVANDDWRTSVPEEIRGHKSLEHISDVGALAKSYVNAQSMIGADKVAIPGKHATDEDWGEVYRKLGRPDSPDGYELANELPEGAEASDEMLGWFKGAAHEAGLTPQQAQKLLGGYNEFLGGMMGSDDGQVQEARANAEVELKKEYGQAFDDRMAVGKGVLDNFSSIPIEEFEDLTLSNGMKLGDHPAIIKTMVNIGQYMKEKMGEDTLAGVKTTGGLSPNEASEKIAELTAPSTPYWDAKHPQHSFYVDEAMRYREMM